MADLRPMRAVYKVLEGQEIDADVYLPTHYHESRHPVVLNFHGGAHMLGSAAIINKDQVRDCLTRNWIVVAANHRLCPGVDLLNGPMQDCRDLLAWVYDGGGLAETLAEAGKGAYVIDHKYVFAMGTSAGGHLALCLGFDVPRPVAGIYNIYGACDFSAPFWTQKVPHIQAILPMNMTEDFIHQIYQEKPIPIRGGISLEGQAVGPPDFTDPRQAFVMKQIANGTVLDAICPSKNFDKVDPVRNIRTGFPPTFIVHGQEDENIHIDVSRKLYAAFQSHGIKCGMKEVPGEGHTFAARMTVGSQTWLLQREGFDFLESLIEKKE